jgi:hypothetical protein
VTSSRSRATIDASLDTYDGAVNTGPLAAAAGKM